MTTKAQPAPTSSLAKPLLAMAHVFDRLAEEETNPEHLRQLKLSAESARRDATKA